MKALLFNSILYPTYTGLSTIINFDDVLMAELNSDDRNINSIIFRIEIYFKGNAKDSHILYFSSPKERNEIFEKIYILMKDGREVVTEYIPS